MEGINSIAFDNWFFDSFKRYHKLQMFYLDKPVLSMELSDDSSVCVASENPGDNRFEILNLELPSKLFQIENEHDSINTVRDLKYKCGTLTNGRLIDMKTLFDKSKVILSEEGVSKVIVYEMDSNRSDQMIPLLNIESKVDSGYLAVDYTTDTLVVWGKENTLHITGCVFDIENNKQTLEFRNESNDEMCSYKPYFMSKDELLVLNSEKGFLDLYDLTSGQHIQKIDLPEDALNVSWYTNTMYTSSKETTTFNLALVANSGTLLTYDLRNCKIPKVYQRDFFSKCKTDININFDSNNAHKCAVSGTDSNVYIIEDESKSHSKMAHTFKHDGHIFHESEEECIDKMTTCNLWLPKCGNNTLLSAADDGSVQAWQYVS